MSVAIQSNPAFLNNEICQNILFYIPLARNFLSMWQKLNRLDTIELEKARIQILNAAQLVCAVPRCYMKSNKNKKKDWLHWKADTSTLESNVFGLKEKVKISLDIEQFVLSIHGSKNHIEHLVLSGMTYPMAFGWMKIKLDSFHLDADCFNDAANYSIEHTVNGDEDLHVTKQHVFNSLAIYYSNAQDISSQLAEDLNLSGEQPLIDPSNMNLTFETDKKSGAFIFGFSPGDKNYPEPYYFLQLKEVNDSILNRLSRTIGIWNTKNWNGLVFLASDFLTLEPDVEKNRVIEFFNTNYWSLKGN